MKVLAKIGLTLTGVIMFILGIVILACPLETVVALSWLWAILFLAGGIISIISFFVLGKNFPGRTFLLVIGIVQVILGLSLISSGAFFTTAVVLTMCQIWIIFSGIESIVVSVDLKHFGDRYWWLSLVLGILCIIIGSSSFGSAVFSTSFITVSVSIGLFFSGIFFIQKAWRK